MKSMSDLLRDFSQMRNELKALQTNFPIIVGTEAVREIKNNFTKQGYDLGAGTEKWKPRSPVTNAMYDARKGVKGSAYRSGNPILLQTRNLYNAISYKVNGKRIFIGVNLAIVPYAYDLNEGNRAKRLPARKFLPTHGEPIPNIEQAYRKRYDIQFKKIMRKFKK